MLGRLGLQDLKDESLRGISAVCRYNGRSEATSTFIQASLRNALQTFGRGRLRLSIPLKVCTDTCVWHIHIFGPCNQF